MPLWIGWNRYDGITRPVWLHVREMHLSPAPGWRYARLRSVLIQHLPSFASTLRELNLAVPDWKNTVLTLNGRSLGKGISSAGEYPSITNAPLVWKNVAFEEGTLEVTARFGSQKIVDRRTTAGKPARDRHACLFCSGSYHPASNRRTHCYYPWEEFFVMDIWSIQQYFYNSSAEAINAFFDIPPATLPYFKDFKGNWDLGSRRNAKFTFYLTEGRHIELNVSDSSRESIYHKKWKGMKGFNEVEWDLVIEINQGKTVYALPEINLPILVNTVCYYQERGSAWSRNWLFRNRTVY